jgi:hypothetical protein
VKSVFVFVFLILIGIALAGSYIYFANELCPHELPREPLNLRISWLIKFSCEAKISDIAIAFFTWCLAVVTGWLVWATVGLRSVTAELVRFAEQQGVDMRASVESAIQSTKAAIASNQIAVTNAEQQLRAYVTARDLNLTVHRQPPTPGAYIQIEGRAHTYGFAAILRNGGQTPAINVTINVSCEKLAKELPADLDFPDSDLFGHGLIGPDSEIHTPIIRISAQEIERIEPDTAWYLWGWIEYDDIFTRTGSTSRHRTEFCFQIDRERLPPTNEFWMGFRPHPRFNAADWDCLRPIDPVTNQSSG